jgi:hypothetical protein
LSGKKERKNARSGYPESKEPLYNKDAGSEPARTTRNASPAKTLRVILPDELPCLDPAAARALLQILIKAHARLENRDNSEGAE